jgi:hypothetical protein
VLRRPIESTALIGKVKRYSKSTITRLHRTLSEKTVIDAEWKFDFHYMPGYLDSSTSRWRNSIWRSFCRVRKIVTSGSP